MRKRDRSGARSIELVPHLAHFRPSRARRPPPFALAKPGRGSPDHHPGKDRAQQQRKEWNHHGERRTRLIERIERHADRVSIGDRKSDAELRKQTYAFMLVGFFLFTHPKVSRQKNERY